MVIILLFTENTLIGKEIKIAFTRLQRKHSQLIEVININGTKGILHWLYTEKIQDCVCQCKSIIGFGLL